MQLARCPECGSPVGVQSHTPAAGVQQVRDMKALGREMNRMGV